MSKSLKSLVVISVAFALGMPAIAAASPQDELHGKGVKVSYADLNLQNTEGAKVLYLRLQNAARWACDVRSVRVHGTYTDYADAKRCYREALDASVAKVDNPQVNRIHAG